MTDTTTEPREPDNPAAWALAQHIADHPVSTIQAAFRYLNAPLAIELREEPAAVLPAPADRAACQWPACMPEAQQQALTADVQREMRPPTDRAAWDDGDPLMEAIAAAVWEQCDTSGGYSIVTDDPRNIAAVAATVARAQRPPADRAALRQRIAEALERADYRPDMRRGDLADAVLAVLPTPTDQAAVLREAADRFDGMPEADASALRKGITWATSELRRLAAEEQPTTEARQDEDPARIDRLRPEFTEHASIEAIDVQLRRSRAQQRRWHLRTEWLISLRAGRVAQKERGEWPATEAQAEREPATEECACGHPDAWHDPWEGCVGPNGPGGVGSGDCPCPEPATEPTA